jgi:hypothetical protein
MRRRRPWNSIIPIENQMVSIVVSSNRDRESGLKIVGETIRRPGTEAAAHAHLR